MVCSTANLTLRFIEFTDVYVHGRCAQTGQECLNYLEISAIY